MNPKDKSYKEEQKVYWDIEPHMLYDYVNFANHIRVAQASDDRYKKFSMKQDGSRWFLMIFTELYQKSLEDLSVILLAFYRRFNTDVGCEYQKKFSVVETPIAYTQINYKTHEATIKRVLDYFKNQGELIRGLRIDDIEKVDINFIFPEMNFQKFYNDLYNNLVAWSEDQEKRFRLYNKIKHGPAIVGSARIFNPKNEDAPAVVYADHSTDLTDHPLFVHSLHFKESEFILLRGGVLKISQCIRDLISIYMCKNYSDILKKKGFASPLFFFKQRRPGIKEG